MFQSTICSKAVKAAENSVPVKRESNKVNTNLVGSDSSEFFVDLVQPVGGVLPFPFSLLHLFLQLLQLGQQARPLDVGRENGLEGGSVVGDDLLLAVEDVDVRRNLQSPITDVPEQRRFAVAVRAY